MAPRIEAFNGDDGCRGDASFIRDLYRRGLLFRRVAFVTGRAPYRREYQLKGGTSALASIFFFNFAPLRAHSLVDSWKKKRARVRSSRNVIDLIETSSRCNRRVRKPKIH